MRAKCIFLAKTQGRKKTYLDEENMYLFSKLSLSYGGNVSHYKSVHHPLSTLSVVIGNTLAVFKANQFGLFPNECPGIFSFLST